MKVYVADESVDISLPLIDAAGRDLVPTALSYSVLDDEGEVIQPATEITVPGSPVTKINFTVPAGANELTGDLNIGFRRVKLLVTTATRSVELTSDYLVEASQVFTIPTNSFQTYETALVMARTIAPLNGWNAASAETRKFALFRAFDLMKSFTYEMRYLEGGLDEMSLNDLDEATYDRLLTSQIMDFRKAQLTQADYLLGGNPIEKDIQDGLQSSTIGEISQFYRPRPTLNLALCKVALSYVGKYIVWNLRVGRT